MYYLCFHIAKIPDLTLAKYNSFDGQGIDNVLEKHSVFLRQLHRLGNYSKVYFHLLYCYDADPALEHGRHLKIYFYATSAKREKLQGIREFLIKSVLSNYYDFRCYEVTNKFLVDTKNYGVPAVVMTNISEEMKVYGLNGAISPEKLEENAEDIRKGNKQYIVCEIASDANAILRVGDHECEENGRIRNDMRFRYMGFLSKKTYDLVAQNSLPDDRLSLPKLYALYEWEPNETGRLFNVLKLMEGYDRNAAIRIDLFPTDQNKMRDHLPYAQTRKRMSQRGEGRDENCENIIKVWDKYITDIMKYPQFYANIVAFADSPDMAGMLADSIGSEAVESGGYAIEVKESKDLYDVYSQDHDLVFTDTPDPENYFQNNLRFVSLYSLNEIRPMFSFPVLYQGESIECFKETDPAAFSSEKRIDEQNVIHETILLGFSERGYNVNFPISLFKKHAFISGVPGSGKTNTMLHLVTSLWAYSEQKVPFLVLEPAKQEYRALMRLPEMKDVNLFSPGADTHFPIHINPFEFPKGLTLAEHIANLNAVFAGAFYLPSPTPHFLDSSIQQVYIKNGWNVNERNRGDKPYPTMQELYETLEREVERSKYEGEIRGNIESTMEVRIGSLLKREIGFVYNVSTSTIRPEEWINTPAIIEVEALGEGPANFMSLLISTLIRESLKVSKLSHDTKELEEKGFKREIKHIIFYEEAHNLIGSKTENDGEESVDPKVSSTKFLVKMLAEVRALNEGIVIADQLPTAMAPEVLKNTGLKIGHRITAQDDRALLGSTMSASDSQLEEQGIFATGEALVFYENLQKPYKMRVCEWEPLRGKDRYESPSDEELVGILSDTPVYRKNMSVSARIICDKIIRESGSLNKKAKNLMQGISTIPELQKNDDGSYDAQTKAFIDMKRAELIELCREYANFYYTYVSLSENYAIYDPEKDAMLSSLISLQVTREYLRMLPVFSDMPDILELKKTFYDNTKNVVLNTDVFSLDECLYTKVNEKKTYKEYVSFSVFFLSNSIDYERLRIQKYFKDLRKKFKEDPRSQVRAYIGLCKQFLEKLNVWIILVNYQFENSVEMADEVRSVISEKNSQFIAHDEEDKKLSQYTFSIDRLHYSIIDCITSMFEGVTEDICCSTYCYNESKEIRDHLNYYMGYRETEFSDVSKKHRNRFPDLCEKCFPAMKMELNMLIEYDLYYYMKDRFSLPLDRGEDAEGKYRAAAEYAEDILIDKCFSPRNNFGKRNEAYRVALYDRFIRYYRYMKDYLNNCPDIFKYQSKVFETFKVLADELKDSEYFAEERKAAFKEVEGLVKNSDEVM